MIVHEMDIENSTATYIRGNEYIQLELPVENISKLLFLIGQPARIQVLITVGVHEPCTFGYCLPSVSVQSYPPA